MQNVPIQEDDIQKNMPYNYKYTFTYVCIGHFDVDTIGKNDLKRLIGQTHV